MKQPLDYHGPDVPPVKASYLLSPILAACLLCFTVPMMFFCMAFLPWNSPTAFLLVLACPLSGALLALSAWIRMMKRATRGPRFWLSIFIFWLGGLLFVALFLGLFRDTFHH